MTHIRKRISFNVDEIEHIRYLLEAAHKELREMILYRVDHELINPAPIELVTTIAKIKTQLDTLEERLERSRIIEIREPMVNVEESKKNPTEYPGPDIARQ